jgi:hypothetical protein
MPQAGSRWCGSDSERKNTLEYARGNEPPRLFDSGQKGEGAGGEGFAPLNHSPNRQSKIVNRQFPPRSGPGGGGLRSCPAPEVSGSRPVGKEASESRYPWSGGLGSADSLSPSPIAHRASRSPNSSIVKSPKAGAWAPFGLRRLVAAFNPPTCRRAHPPHPIVRLNRERSS